LPGAEAPALGGGAPAALRVDERHQRIHRHMEAVAIAQDERAYIDGRVVVEFQRSDRRRRLAAAADRHARAGIAIAARLARPPADRRHMAAELRLVGWVLAAADALQGPIGIGGNLGHATSSDGDGLPAAAPHPARILASDSETALLARSRAAGRSKSIPPID